MTMTACMPSWESLPAHWPDPAGPESCDLSARVSALSTLAAGFLIGWNRQAKGGPMTQIDKSPLSSITRKRLRDAVEPLMNGALGAAGLTVADVARRYRIGRDKVRQMISRGELAAVNTASARCSRPRWVITPEALAQFEQRRAAGSPAKPARRKKRSCPVDYFPD
jgi:hypothetical protein